MLLAECGGADSQVSNGVTQEWLPWVPDWRHPWIITYGAKLKFPCKCVFVILVSSFRLSWVRLSRDGHQDILRHQLSVSTTKQLQFFITNSLPPPLFPVAWEAEVGHVHWDIRHERGKTGWLIGDISPEGTLSAFWQKKWLTVSVCSVGRHGHPEVGEWRGPEWQKMCQNEDKKTRSCKLCHCQNYAKAKGLLR